MSDDKFGTPINLLKGIEFDPPVDENGMLSPGYGWKLTPQAEAAIKEIDDNRRLAAAIAPFIIVGK